MICLVRYTIEKFLVFHTSFSAFALTWDVKRYTLRFFPPKYAKHSDCFAINQAKISSRAEPRVKGTTRSSLVAITLMCLPFYAAVHH